MNFKTFMCMYTVQGPFRLCQISTWHQYKTCVLLYGTQSKTELLLWSQWEVWHNLSGHPVYCNYRTIINPNARFTATTTTTETSTPSCFQVVATTSTITTLNQVGWMMCKPVNSKFRLRDFTSRVCSTTASAVCFEVRVASLDPSGSTKDENLFNTMFVPLKSAEMGTPTEEKQQPSFVILESLEGKKRACLQLCSNKLLTVNPGRVYHLVSIWTQQKQEMNFLNLNLSWSPCMTQSYLYS